MTELASILEYLSDPGIWARGGEWRRQDMDVVGEVMQNDGYFTRLIDSRGEGEIVIDVGAHIGTFALMWHRKNPQARIVCVEVCPENIPTLTANVGEFATIIQAACTYDPGELSLLNSVKQCGTATGGSTVVRAEDVGSSREGTFGHLYWLDDRPIRKVTIEEILQQIGAERISLLKMDAEGAEFSILEHSPTIASGKVDFMLGEYHGAERWNELRQRRFANGWDYGHMHAAGGLGIFHLRKRTESQP
jgi:FkbM family methyltransferase